MGFKEPEEKEEEEVKPKPGKKDVKEEPKQNIQVVKELPVQQVRSTTDEETGEVTTYVTVEEALTSLLGENI